MRFELLICVQMSMLIDSTIYHTRQWGEVLEDTFGYEYYEITNCKSGGYLPLFLVKSPLTGKRLVGGPFSTGGPIFKNEIVYMEIVDGLKDLMKEVDCKNLSLVSPSPLPAYAGLTKINQHVRFSIPLYNDPDILWNRFKKRGRHGVRKAGKEGVTSRFSDDIRDLQTFYEIFAHTRKRLGIPVFPLEFFVSLREKMPDSFKLILAEYEGKTVAGAVFFEYNGTLTYAYAGSLKKYNIHRPSSLIIWEAIKYGCERGLKELDLGADHESQKSLLKFKEQWGAVKRPFYNYHMGKPPTFSPTSYPVLRKMWSMLPMGITKWAGPRLIRHFG